MDKVKESYAEYFCLSLVEDPREFAVEFKMFSSCFCVLVNWDMERNAFVGIVQDKNRMFGFLKNRHEHIKLTLANYKEEETHIFNEPKSKYKYYIIKNLKFHEPHYLLNLI